MKKIVIIFIFLVSQCGCESAMADSSVVEASIGKLLLSHDKKFSYQKGDNSFGGEILYSEFLAVFNAKVKKLPVKDQADFLWSVMWHLGFDGHSMMEFQKLTLQACGNIFIDRLEKYVERESEYNRDRDRLFLSKKIWMNMMNLKNIQLENGNKK